MRKKISVLLLGILLLALGTSVCSSTGLGIDPFNAFCTGSSRFLGISLGTCVLMVQLILGAAAFCLDRKYLGVGSVIPMVSFGYFLEFFNWFLPNMISFEPMFFIRITMFLIGMLIIAAGMSVYMSCELGMVPYDCFSFIISEKTGKNPFYVRMGFDLSFAVLALLVKGPIYIGTLLLAFGIGPLLHGMNRFRNKTSLA